MLFDIRCPEYGSFAVLPSLQCVLPYESVWKRFKILDPHENSQGVDVFLHDGPSFQIEGRVWGLVGMPVCKHGVWVSRGESAILRDGAPELLQRHLPAVPKIFLVSCVQS